MSPIKPARFRGILPHHQHCDIHPTLSFLWWKTSSPFSIFPFLWCHALLNIPTYAHFTHLHDQPCPRCLSLHPLDPISCLAFCTFFRTLLQSFVSAWPDAFQAPLCQWLFQASPVDRRLFVQTLIPRNLLTFLRQSRVGHGISTPGFWMAVSQGVRHRNKALLPSTKNFLLFCRQNPLPQPLAKPPAHSTWGMTNHPLGSSSRWQPTPLPAFRPPSLPDSVKRPRKRSRRFVEEKVGD